MRQDQSSQIPQPWTPPGGQSKPESKAEPLDMSGEQLRFAARVLKQLNYPYDSDPNISQDRLEQRLAELAIGGINFNSGLQSDDLADELDSVFVAFGAAPELAAQDRINVWNFIHPVTVKSLDDACERIAKEGAHVDGDDSLTGKLQRPVRAILEAVANGDLTIYHVRPL